MLDVPSLQRMNDLGVPNSMRKVYASAISSQSLKLWYDPR
jgi:hypothetical protein